MTAIETNNLSFQYGKKPVLQNLTIQITQGDFFGIIGPNGAGKTTLLKIFAGLLKPQQGEVQLFGKKSDEIPIKERAKLLSYVPQENYFYFDFTVLDVVLFGRHPYLKQMERPKKSDIDKAINALKFTDALEFKNRSVLELSSGERQRVILARALTSEPKILLLDEPTSYLDITHQVEIINILKKLNQEGITIIFLSHDINLTSIACNRVLLLSEGKMIACDVPAKIINKDLIKAVYKIEPQIISSPDSAKPQIILPS
ncbi:MAG: ABC transporter ATP-binding protein [Candidatus Latescibacteria bacterium]|nr:ABC transporter ATP-binding protein [Candidatus Latescibacterota bacterium]